MSDRNRSDEGDDDRFGWPEGSSWGDGQSDSRVRDDPSIRDDSGGRSRTAGSRPRNAGSQAPTSMVRIGGLVFTRRELLDLTVAWVALGLAFSFFLFGGAALVTTPSRLVLALSISMITVGVGFLLHELAHKVVAVRFGQVAHFRADYGMLILAVVAGLAGFLFAAPGAVYHRGRITVRENGLIAIAGPVTNVLLVIPFVPLAFLPGPLGLVGQIGAAINAVLAAFNMIPFGPLDGRTVVSWSLGVYVPFFLLTLALSAAALGLFFGVV